MTISLVPLLVSLPLLVISAGLLLAAIAYWRRTEALITDSVGTWTSLITDEIDALNNMALTIEDLIRVQPEREETLAIALLEVIAHRDEMVRKEDLLTRFAAGTLPVTEMVRTLRRPQ